MSEKMITINGKEFSESTIANALEKQCGVVFKVKEPKWIVAVEGNSRMLLNLSALTDYSKEQLHRALQEKNMWISFCKGGYFGVTSREKNGLTFYASTRIVF